MTFTADLQRFALKAEGLSGALLLNCAEAVRESIVVGSAITGAPGQPVDHGELRASWQMIIESPTSALVATNSAYAPQNEDGIARPGGGPYIQRSSVGGRHSVALTRAGWQRIVDAETAKLRGVG